MTTLVVPFIGEPEYEPALVLKVMPESVEYLCIWVVYSSMISSSVMVVFSMRTSSIMPSK